MLRTLYGKLSLALLGLIFLVSGFYVALTVFTTRLYLQEVSQSLNAGLAANVAQDTVLMADHQIDEAAFKKAFDRLMHINPSVELYLLDEEGAIMAFSTPSGTVARAQVALAPLHAFLDGSRDYPILGEDPRDAERRKVFSVAPILNAGTLEGYLYVVLGGEAQDAVTTALQGSFILRLAAGIAIASALLTLAAGLLSFNFLTRRLRRLAAAMESFKQGGFRKSVRRSTPQRRVGGDEIDQLATTFEEMSLLMTDQIQQLEDADAVRRELFANVSHDLRTPLAAVQGYLETLLIKDDSLSVAQRHEYLELAAKHSRRMGRLIHELFELATLEHPNSSLDVEPFSMAELMQDVSQKFRLAAEKKRLRLDVDIAESTP
ncbi:MAG: sensor histidine kinase, partial [Alphaproteobacteria bacterium]